MPFRRASALLIAALVAAGSGWISAQVPNGPPRPPTGTAFLAGQVVEVPSGRPVPDATVTITSASLAMVGTLMFNLLPNRQPVLTDSQGRFFFANLPAGTFSTRVSKPGYSTAATATGRVAELADGDRVTDLKLHLAKLAAVTGVLRDEGSDPVVGTDVMVFRRTLVNGRATLRPFGQSRTDDRGIYRISGLQPGEYLVCACTRDPIPFDGTLLTSLAADPLHLMGVAGKALTAGADVAGLETSLRTFAPTFYPGSATVARATLVTLAPGDERSGVDINVAATRSTRVSGTIIGAVSPVSASSVRLVPAGETDDGATLTQLQPMLVQPDGRFDFASVPPGQYVLRVSHVVTTARGGGAPSGAALAFLGARGNAMGAPGVNQTPNDYPLWAAEPVTVGDDGVRGLSIALHGGVHVSGRVQFEGTTPAPAPQAIAGMAVIVQPVTPDPVSPANPAIGRVTADGTFQMMPVTPGRYSFNSTLIPKWTSLKSMTLGGVDVADLPIDVGTTDISDFTITFTDVPLGTLVSTLTGGKPDEDITVLVFPADRRYWTDPGAAQRRFVTAPIGRNGSSTPLPLAAGEYFAVAVPDDAAVEWKEATRLETLSRGATRVQIVNGDKKTIEVKR